MKPYYVINWNFNSDNIEYYDIIPYLKSRYDEISKKPKTFEEIKNFILKESMYQFWSRCQYEIIITGWPQQRNSVKIDVYDQIKNNIDVITNHFISQCK